MQITDAMMAEVVGWKPVYEAFPRGTTEPDYYETPSGERIKPCDWHPTTDISQAMNQVVPRMGDLRYEVMIDSTIEGDFGLSYTVTFTPVGAKTVGPGATSFSLAAATCRAAVLAIQPIWKAAKQGKITRSRCAEILGIPLSEVRAKVNEGRDDTIEDGFGSVWSKTCPECGKQTMQVVRPGKVQCTECAEKGGE